jgi:hypothetical protein
MAFDRYADNNSVPPKSCRLQEVRENLPQSFHSLAVSEPDPITLFTPYILSVFWLCNGYATIQLIHPDHYHVPQILRANTEEFYFSL